MTVKELLKALNAEDRGCKVKIVVNGTVLEIDEVAWRNVDYLSDPDPIDGEVHLLSAKAPA